MQLEAGHQYSWESHLSDHVLRRIPSMRATTLARSGNTQFFRGKEQVNWGEVYILYFNWGLSPAFKTGFHFNFWATPSLSVSPHNRFSSSPTPQGPWLDLLQYCCSFFVPGESRAGLGMVSLVLSRGEESPPLTWWQHNSQHSPGIVGPLCCQGPHLPHAQLAQSMAELLSSQLAPASAGWAFLSPGAGLGRRVPLQNFMCFLHITYFPSLLRSL